MTSTDWILFGLVLLCLLMLATLAFVVLHRRHLNQISDRLMEGAVDDGETLKHVVERQGDATRLHVSQAVDAIQHNTEVTKSRVTDFIEQQTRDAKEFRGQLTVHKTRIQWLVGVVETLVSHVRALFHGKPPP